MSEGVFVMGVVDSGKSNDANYPYPPKDNFRRFTTSVPFGIAGVVVAAKPGRLYLATLANSSATLGYWAQVFDSATLPTNGAAPIWVTRIASASSALIDLTEVNGIACVNGISLAISTTPNTLTLAAADDLSLASVVFTSQR